MKTLNRILLFCFLLGSFSANAIHIKGGWMYYEYIGSSGGYNQYKFVVKVYRDCAIPNPGQNDPQINITVFRNSDNSKIGDYVAPQSKIYRLQKTTFSDCINPKPSVCYVILEYTATISLPDAPGGYEASFQRCCRINGIVNVLPPSNTYGNTYSIYIPGNDVPTGVINSSPKYAEKDTAIVCYNSDFVLDYSATDPDGDSLVYSFTSALVGGSESNPNPSSAAPPPYVSIPYGAGYDALDPFGTNVTIDSKTGIIKGRSPSVTGEYVLAVMIKEYRNGQYIAQTRKELHVNVSACTLATATLPDRIMSCDGYTVQFQNLSTSPAINSYYWDFGVKGISTDTSTLPTPSYTYPDTGTYSAKLVVNPNSTCTDSAITEVRVYPGFFPNFDYNGSCFANPWQFNDRSTTNYGVINSWYWNFGVTGNTADTSILKNPQYLFPQQTGSYTVLLKVTSDKGCEDTVTKQITVTDKPVLQLAFRDTLICSIDSLVLNASGTGSFSWAPNYQIINANTATPTVFPQVTTTYNVTLNDRGCTASDSVLVNVLDHITVDAGNDTTICRTDGIILSPVSQGLQFVWTPATGLSNPNTRNPIAAPVAPQTTYKVIANLGKCQAADSITIRTVAYPVANAGTDTSICFNDTVTLRGSTTGGNISWAPANLVAFPNNLVTPAYPKATTAFVLSVYQNLGCPKPGTDTVLVNVVPPLNVFAGNDTTVVIGQPLQLNGMSNGSVYRWTPAIGLSDPNIANPVAVFNRGTFPAGQDQIRYVLNVSTPEGCVSSDDIVVRLFTTPPSIFVPNAFTPNQDGKNDLMRPTLAGMKQLLYFRIYNRYGQLVFETKQIGRGWDGAIKGMPQNSSAYVYDCQAEDYNGNLVKQSGTFVLVR